MESQIDIQNTVLPTIDEFLSTNLSEEHQSIYVLLLKERYSSTEKFPVNFDILVNSLGYTRKDSAKDILIKNFKADIEYVLLRFKPEQKYGEKRGGHNKEIIYLTLDCAQ